MGASSRVRSIQFRTKLEEKTNASIHISSLFGNRYIKALYGKSNLKYIFAIIGYIKRFLFLFFCLGKYDLIIVEKELFPYLPSCFEKLISLYHKPYVLDYDDAIFHNYTKYDSGIMRFLLRNKLTELIRNAELVHCGNPYIESFMLSTGAKRTKIVPTVIDLEKYISQSQSFDTHSKFIVGWIGSPSTTKYLASIMGVLEDLASKYDIAFVTIGASEITSDKLEIIQYPWTEESEARLLSQISVGIMPLPDEKWERGKCGYKLIQYMALKKPVIASPVGVNSFLVTDDVGYLCNSDEEWATALETLINDADKQRLMGASGFSLVCEKYNTDKISDELARTINDYKK